MNATKSIGALCVVFSCISFAAWSSTTGWPDVTAKLSQARTQVRACVKLLKSVGDKDAIVQAQVAYGSAQGAADGAIEGFTTALVQGSAPQNLPTLQTYLDSMGAGLQTVCDTAVKSAKTATGTKGVLDKMVTAAVAPIIEALKSAAVALWGQHVQQVKLEIETIKTQLDKARWPDF